MLPIYILLGVIIILLVILLVKNNKDTSLDGKLSGLHNEIARIEAAVKNDFVANRMETNEAARQARQELAVSLRSFEEKLNSFTSIVDNKLQQFDETGSKNAKETRTEIKQALDLFKHDFSKSVELFNTAQKDNFFALLNKQSEQNVNTVNRLDQLRDTVEKKITDMQSGNEKKLDEMRATVDEKLQKTLEARLGESFKLVSERLEAVHKGLGDMQQLATGVGDLKSVLSNVKTRGVLGEYQLENILEQMLTPEQYAKNVKTKESSNAIVEFAVKLPGKSDKDKMIWLPVDSKFPKEDFELLTDAYENGQPELVEEYRRNFIKGIRKCATDICTKYIDPPQTTDFAILFLPFESLYAEVLRSPVCSNLFSGSIKSLSQVPQRCLHY